MQRFYKIVIRWTPNFKLLQDMCVGIVVTMVLAVHRAQLGSCPPADSNGRMNSSVTFTAFPQPSLVPWPAGVEIDAG